VDLSIAIVNYNTKGYLEECLTSLSQYPPCCSFEILVVDNASKDGSVDMARERFPTVRLLENAENVGYAAAINRALRESTGEFLLVLNPDVRVTEGSVDALLAFMRAQPRAGIAGSKLLNADGTLQYSCRTFYTLKIMLYRRTFLGRVFKDSPVVRRHLMMDWDHNSVREVDWVLGACLMVRRSAVEEVGPADERFFLYLEDVDWCFRMKSRGWGVYYCPDSVMYHHYRRDSAKDFFGPGVRAHLASAFRFYEKWNMALYLLKRHGRGLSTAATVLGDAVAVISAFLAAYYARAVLGIFLKKPLYPLSTYWGFMAYTVAVALLSLAFFGLYRRRYGADWVDELVDSGKALSIACVVLMASTFVLYLRDYSRVVIVGFWPGSIAAVTALRLGMRRATAAARASGFGARRVLVLGSADSRAEVGARVKPAGDSHLELVSAPESVVDALREGDASAAGVLVHFTDEQRITDVVCVTEDIDEAALGELIGHLGRQGLRVRLYTKAARMLTSRSTVEELGDVGLITIGERHGCPSESVAKRAFDLLVAVPASAVLVIYLAVAGIISRFGGRGPVLVKRVLVGKGGRYFNASFPAGAELEDGLPAGLRGRLLLLFNVVTGQLSFVGPKPLTPEVWEEAGSAWKGTRAGLVPGIIGPRSAVGNRDGGADDPQAADLQYLREWSLGLDAKIVIRALAGGIRPAYAERKA
jgi:hypothetical protein